eukprot:265089-Chlamydomonas_euryale.AAC.1
MPPAALRGSGAARVLLLPVKQGGAGLTLTEAQHVILVEPLLDIGMELQVRGGGRGDEDPWVDHMV